MLKCSHNRALKYEQFIFWFHVCVKKEGHEGSSLPESSLSFSLGKAKISPESAFGSKKEG